MKLKKLNIKKPSELDNIQIVQFVYAGLNGGLACYCPDCGAEHEWLSDWPIDIRIHCGEDYDALNQLDENCDCIFVIPNNVQIEE